MLQFYWSMYDDSMYLCWAMNMLNVRSWYGYDNASDDVYHACLIHYDYNVLISQMKGYDERKFSSKTKEIMTMFILGVKLQWLMIRFMSKWWLKGYSQWDLILTLMD